VSGFKRGASFLTHISATNKTVFLKKPRGTEAKAYLICSSVSFFILGSDPQTFPSPQLHRRKACGIRPALYEGKGVARIFWVPVRIIKMAAHKRNYKQKHNYFNFLIFGSLI